MADLVVIPGSKATRADMAFLREQGWDIDVHAHVRRGGAVLGICGGYQMLGRRVADPDGIEGPAGKAPASACSTSPPPWPEPSGWPRRGGRPAQRGSGAGLRDAYGVTDGPGRSRPFLRVDGRPEGARSVDGRVMGTYLHGLFAADGFRRAFLGRLGLPARRQVQYEATVDAALDAIADLLEANLDLDALLDLSVRPSP